MHDALARNLIGIDHLAVAVKDLELAVKWCTHALGCEVIERRETQGKISGMRSVVLRLGNVVLVLLQGTNAASQISRYVEEYGLGVQHIALRVRDLPAVVRGMSASGASFSTDILANGLLSQIFSARDPSTGLMLELIERHGYEGFSDDNVQKLFDRLEETSNY